MMMVRWFQGDRITSLERRVQVNRGGRLCAGKARIVPKTAKAIRRVDLNGRCARSRPLVSTHLLIAQVAHADSITKENPNIGVFGRFLGELRGVTRLVLQ